MLVLTLSAVVQLYADVTRSEAIYRQSLTITRAVASMQVHSHHLDHLLHKLTDMPPPHQVDTLLQSIIVHEQRIAESLEVLRTQWPNEPALQQVQVAFDDWTGTRQYIKQTVQQGRAIPAGQLHINDIYAATIESATNELMAQARANAEQASQVVYNRTQQAVMQIGLVALVAAVMIAGIGWWLWASILPPVRRIFALLPTVSESTAANELSLITEGIGALRRQHLLDLEAHHRQLEHKIAHRQNVEDQLRQLQANVKSIFNNNLQMFTIFDRAGRVLMFNEMTAQWTKAVFEVDIATGMPIYEVILPEHMDTFQQAMAAALEGQTSKSEYKITMPPDRQVYWAEANYVPVRADNGTITGVCLFAVDITARKQAEVEMQQAKEAAEAADRAKTQFLASMSHELRTPLNSILGFTQMLKNDTSLSKLQRDNIATIYDSSKHLLTLINDVLDLSKIEAGQAGLYPTEFVLSDFLSGVINMLQPHAEQKGILLTYQPTLPLPNLIQADERALRQVLLNLLGNAIKFTDQGQVTLKVALLSTQPLDTLSGYQLGQLQFKIADTGQGILPAQLAAIFKPFHQVSNHTAGTGLGLAISQKLVELMGSTIHVQSQPEHGSIFWFELQVPYIFYQQTMLPIENNVIIGYHGTPYRILIIDGVAENITVLRDALQPLGFVINEATAYTEALYLGRQFMPHLVLVNLSMEPDNIATLITQLRNDSFIPPPVVIGIVTENTDQMRQRCLEADCDNFIITPIDLMSLLTLIEWRLELTWVYQSAGTETSSEPTPSLPHEVFHRLQTYAHNGDIQGLLDEIAVLENRDSQYQPFVIQLQRLLNDYRINEVETLLQQYYEEHYV